MKIEELLELLTDQSNVDDDIYEWCLTNPDIMLTYKVKDPLYGDEDTIIVSCVTNDPDHPDSYTITWEGTAWVLEVGKDYPIFVWDKRPSVDWANAPDGAGGTV